ncbi:MAG: hypothetical protein RL141_420 [Candidatus Parcubacteria bacterium]|jgi:hypothetical protein
MIQKAQHKKAWVISADMGYGHDRAAHGIEALAYGKVITANRYEGIPEADRRMWFQTRRIYETISRLKPIPFFGPLLFNTMDRFQAIQPFYPRRDLSAPTIQLRATYRYIRKGLCRDLTERLMKRRLPVICTFPIPAFALEEHGYPDDIYVVVTDTDMSRAWVPLDPKRSKIKYFAPTGRVVERLKLYGIRSENIFLTGFPLPKSLVGGEDGEVVKNTLAQRLCNLDPNGIFTKRYWQTLSAELGSTRCLSFKPHPVTLTFAVGGAGAQRHIGLEIAKSLALPIKRGVMRLVLVAGTRKEVADYFMQGLKALGLSGSRSGVEVFYAPKRHDYFHGFDRILARTDILWTKPSELSFYTGVGIPIVMSPPVGSQEDYNKLWLLNVGGGIVAHDASTCNEWLNDWIQSGGLARIAWNGYIEAPTHGTYRIQSILTGEKVGLETLPLIV